MSAAAPARHAWRNRLLFEASPQAMWVVERGSRRFLDVNDAAIERYGYTRDEMLALTLDAISTSEALGEKLAAVTEHGHVTVWPSRHRTKLGSFVDVEVTAHAIEVDGTRAALAVIVDVTERKRMEQAVRESEQRYRRIVDNAAEGIFTYDAEGTITFANPAMAEMLAASATEIVGRSLFDFTFAEDMGVTLERVSRRAQGESERSEARLRRSDGGALAVRTHAVPLRDPHGVFEGGLVLVSDVTELKRTEEQLRQAVKMEAVGALAGGVAHDFNNLLSVILSYTSMLAEEPLDEPTQAAVREIHEAGQRAACLTRQLLAFSRKQVLEPSVIDMNAVVAGLRAMMARLLGERIELVIIPSDAPAKVHADRGQLEQVLLNLAVNARDAMPNGGRLTLRTTTHSGYVSVSVTDTGIGMNAETQRRIFEPFFTTKERGKGTGLGLASVYGIVQQSGGRVLVTSELGKGARFEVLLPESARALDASSSPEVLGASMGDGESVLLVEDDAQVRQAVAAILRKAGYEVLEAGNAGEALLIAEEKSATIDLLLTDVVMPRMTGPQLAQRLIMLRPNVPVVYMSGHAEDALLDACHEVLAKPLVPRVLLRSVRSALSRPAE